MEFSCKIEGTEVVIASIPERKILEFSTQQLSFSESVSVLEITV